MSSVHWCWIGLILLVGCGGSPDLGVVDPPVDLPLEQPPDSLELLSENEEAHPRHFSPKQVSETGEAGEVTPNQPPSGRPQLPITCHLRKKRSVFPLFIYVNQQGEVEGRSSRFLFTFEVIGPGVNLGAFDILNVSTDSGDFDLHPRDPRVHPLERTGTFSVSGHVRLMVQVSVSGLDRPLQCQLPVFIETRPIPTRAIIRKYNDRTGDQGFTTDERRFGADPGYTDIGIGLHLYQRPSRSCSIPIFATRLGPFRGVAINPESEGHQRQFLLGYCCPVQFAGTRHIYRLNANNNAPFLLLYRETVDTHLVAGFTLDPSDPYRPPELGGTGGEPKHYCFAPG